MEDLDRGVVAVRQEDGNVFVSWRWLGTELDDVSFHVFRASDGKEPVQLSTEGIGGATYWIDTGAPPASNHTYTVRAIARGRLQEPGRGFALPANAPARNYLEIPLQLPPDTMPGDASAADLDGDGDYEIVLKGIQRSRDSASPGTTGNTVLQAYQTDGQCMWTVQMGLNIREGEHDTQFLVYDLDGDGRAELACRTSDGSLDGAGKTIGQSGRDWRDLQPGSRSLGKNMTGPEYLTIFDGLSGKELASAAYVPNQLPLDGWGGIGGNSGNDSTGNRNMRFLACVAYLDGQRPSLVMCRGVYGRTVLAAWDWRDRKLTQRWVFDSGQHARAGAPYVTQDASVDPKLGLNKIVDHAGRWEGLFKNTGMIWDRDGVSEYRRVQSVDGPVVTVDQDVTPGAHRAAHVYGYSGMGGHSVSVADVDGDGKDEIIYKSMVVDDDGTGLFSTGLRHGDALHVSDLDPQRPGLEVFGPHENEGGPWDRWTPAASLFDAANGQILWSMGHGGDAERGLTGDIDPRHPGCELWGIPGGLYSIRGEKISDNGPRMTNFVLWWDGDELREMVDGNRIAKWNWEANRLEPLLVAEGAQAAAGTKSSPVLVADLLGDWREECLLRVGREALRIYTTTAPTSRRIRTLMHDPQYRLAIAWQNVSYNQPPHPSFFIGHAMAPPTPPRIRLVPRSERPDETR
jgi:rhamnogalacturonan endolyase